MLSEGLGILVVNSMVEDPDRLGSPVVINDHLLAADDHRASELARREPTQLHVGDHPRWVAERDEGNIRNSGHDGISPGRANLGWQLLEPIQEDREIVRAEVPDDAHIGLVETEVDSAG